MLKKLTLVVSLCFATLASAQDMPIPLPENPPLPPERPVFVLSALTPYESIYQALRMDRIWTDGTNLSPLVEELKLALLKAADHGLTKVYWTPSLENMKQNFSPELADAFEIEATQALVKFASDLNAGQVEPELVGEEIKVSKKSAPLAAIAAALKNTTQRFSVSIESLAPSWPLYKSLQRALARLTSLEPNQWPNLTAPRKNFRVGDKDAMFGALKIRLQTLGYPVTEYTNVYTKELQTVVAQYYTEQTLPGTPSLNVDSGFWTHHLVPLNSRIQQIRLSMEKLRWLRSVRPENHIFVNLALQKFRLFEGDNVALEFRTINGRSKRKSPMLEDKITTIELNPDWTVPVKLIVEDKAPAMMRDPDFLNRSHMSVYDQYGRELAPWEIDWSRMNKYYASQITIKQSPGLGNALGIMKFHLTNGYSIYLHDTNERHLFKENHRLLSSGCIRLEKPLELSEYLLKDDPKYSNTDEIDSRLATTEVIDPWLPAKFLIPLKKSMPVFLTYLTAEADLNTSLIRFANDYYDQDRRLFDVMSGRRIQQVVNESELGELY